jgi:hypothetical protein
MQPKGNPMKLSKAQKEIVDLMKDGWELGHSRGMHTRTWIQKGGVGRGGDTKSISVSTFHILLDKKLVELSIESFPTSKYNLTELGKST